MMLTLCPNNGHRGGVMKVYHVDLVVTNVETYRVEANDKDGAYEKLAKGDAELIKIKSIDTTFDISVGLGPIKCVEVEEE
jgi:hypothetical protein